MDPYREYTADNLDDTSITYAEYIAESLDDTIKYSEYIAESLVNNQPISYSEYFAENLDNRKIKTKGEIKREERKEKLNEIFGEESKSK